jgi:protein-disulfide isomerase
MENHHPSAAGGDKPGRPRSSYAPHVLSALSLVIAVAALLIAADVIPIGARSDFNSRVRAYILANPQVILDSVKAESEPGQDVADDELAELLAQRHGELFNDQTAPVGINATGEAALVQFFDYNCPYCRKAQPILEALEKDNKALRLIYKEFPILGPGSTFAAKAALASRKQGKYLEFHRAMMTHTGAITETSVMEIAASLGVNLDQLKTDMADPAIEDSLNRNLALAGDLRINGTPSIVTPKEIIRGLVGPEVLNKALADAGKK